MSKKLFLSILCVGFLAMSSTQVQTMKKEFEPAGNDYPFDNLRQSCFVNSSLQCLFKCKHLAKVLHNVTGTNIDSCDCDNANKKEALKNYLKLNNKVHLKKDDSPDYNNIKDLHVSFRKALENGYDFPLDIQNDSYNMLNAFLATMTKHLPQTRELFQIISIDKLKCETCNREDDDKNKNIIYEVGIKNKNIDTLHKSFQTSISPFDVAINAGICNLHKNTQRQCIIKLPKILIIRIDRGSSLELKVAFPFELDMSPYVAYDYKLDKIKTTYYDLIGINVKSGGTNSGHYWSYVKNFDGKNWVYFSDNIINKNQLKKVKKIAATGTDNGGAPMVLFYARKDFDPTKLLMQRKNQFQQFSLKDSDADALKKECNEISKIKNKRTKKSVEIKKTIEEILKKGDKDILKTLLLAPKKSNVDNISDDFPNEDSDDEFPNEDSDDDFPDDGELEPSIENKISNKIDFIHQQLKKIFDDNNPVQRKTSGKDVKTLLQKIGDEAKKQVLEKSITTIKKRIEPFEQLNNKIDQHKQEYDILAYESRTILEAINHSINVKSAVNDPLLVQETHGYALKIVCQLSSKKNSWSKEIAAEINNVRRNLGLNEEKFSKENEDFSSNNSKFPEHEDEQQQPTPEEIEARERQASGCNCVML